jgi:hypothetical protein
MAVAGRRSAEPPEPGHESPDPPRVVAVVVAVGAEQAGLLGGHLEPDPDRRAEQQDEGQPGRRSRA